MKQILTAGEILLTKSLGQNFLHDGNQLGRIVEAAELCNEDKVLEVGPGLGPLTERLISHAGEVLAIEKDLRLVQILNQRLKTHERALTLTVLEDDALEFVRRERRDWSGWKLVANLPYTIASPLLVECALIEDGPERLVVTLQLEVARRLTAKSDSADYGVLTLLVQIGYELRDWFRIPAGCFFPEPNVDSACVCLVKRKPVMLRAADRQVFARIVKQAFSQRRKMMLKLLRETWCDVDWATVFSEARIASGARGETVSLEQFVTITRHLSRIKI